MPLALVSPSGDRRFVLPDGATLVLGRETTCDLPILDRLGSWPALSQLTPAERVEYDAAAADYRARHGDCHAHRWTMSGSRMQHCGFCCPPPPLSREQIDSVRCAGGGAIS